MAFLKVVPLEEAVKVIESFNLEPKVEKVSLEQALGRVLAEDVVSPIDVPPLTGPPLMATQFALRIPSWRARANLLS